MCVAVTFNPQRHSVIGSGFQSRLWIYRRNVSLVLRITTLDSRSCGASLPSNALKRSTLLAAVCAAGLMLGGCLEQRNYQGYQIPHDAEQQVPVGASKDQALLAFGTPTTTAEFGNEVYYYVSQVSSRPVAFARSKVVDQRILAVYFDDQERVQQIANYGLQDGRVFDFISRTTPTGGSDVSFVSQLLSAAGRTNPIGN